VPNTDRERVRRPIHTRGPIRGGRRRSDGRRASWRSAADYVGMDVEDDAGFWSCRQRDDSLRQQKQDQHTVNDDTGVSPSRPDRPTRHSFASASGLAPRALSVRFHRTRSRRRIRLGYVARSQVALGECKSTVEGRGFLEVVAGLVSEYVLVVP